MDYLKTIPKIDTLILDCLKRIPGNFAHASLEEALGWVADLKPRRALLVGMGCGIGDHDDANAYIRSRGYEHVELAYDGLYVSGYQL
jgi:phosphoribosyl 1,2-cyclic phosphodiesterase